MFPGQSQDQGEWFTKGQLKTNFPSTWKAMLDSWKEIKGGSVMPSGEEDTTTVGGSVQEGGAIAAAGGGGDNAAAEAAAAAGVLGGGEHQASVIQGEYNNPEDIILQHQQQQRQEMSDRLPSPPLLPEPDVVPNHGYNPAAARGITRFGSGTNPAPPPPRVQLYPQPEGHAGHLLPLPRGDGGVFLPVTAAGISPTGQLQWDPVHQPRNEPLPEPLASIPRVADLRQGGGGIRRAQPVHYAQRPILPHPLPPRVARGNNGKANSTQVPAPAAARVHPLIRKNLEYAQKHQIKKKAATPLEPKQVVQQSAEPEQQQQQKDKSRAIAKAKPQPKTKPKPRGGKGQRGKRMPPGEVVEEEAVVGLNELRQNRESTEEKEGKIEETEEEKEEELVEELGKGKRRRRVMPGPSRNPKKNKPEGATPIPITAAAIAGPSAEIEEEEEEQDDPVEIVDEEMEELQDFPIMDEPMPLPDTEDEGAEEEEEDAVKGEEEEEDDLADFEKEAGLSEEEKQRRRLLRLYLQPDMWVHAQITGAKHTGQHPEMFVVWEDGFKENFPSKWLLGPKLIHCMYSLIEFYESKTKRKKPVRAAGKR
jgi:hypothetical protein